MATAVVEPPLARRPARRGREHWFFWGMSVLVAAIAFIGFSRTYFLAGFFHARPLPGPIVHVHGALFTGWILLLVVQTSLAASGRADLHRRLGLAGLVLAPLVAAFGIIVATEMVRRLAAVPSIDAKGIFAVALSEIAGFAVPVFFAFRLRRRPAVHKRLILIGTIAMTTAGFGRWPIPFLLHKPLPAMLAAFSLLLLVGAYDLVSMRKIHRATALAGLWVVLIELTGVAVGHTAIWRAFAGQIQSLGR